MRRVALLIGNSTFASDSGIANLRFPPADVKALAAVLQNPEIGRFDRIESLVESPRDEILTTLATLLDDERGATVLCYYSGHGKISDGGRLILAARNTTGRLLSATGVPFASILEMKDDFGCARFCVVLDCCYAGLGSQDIRGSGDERLKAFAEGKGVFFLGAANATAVAKEDTDLGHGILTAAILEGLTSGLADVDNDGRITGPDLFAWCRDYAIRRKSHRPVQVNRVIDDDLVIAFSPRRHAGEVSHSERKPMIRHSRPGVRVAALAVGGATLVLGGWIGLYRMGVAVWVPWALSTTELQSKINYTFGAFDQYLIKLRPSIVEPYSAAAIQVSMGGSIKATGTHFEIENVLQCPADATITAGGSSDWECAGLGWALAAYLTHSFKNDPGGFNVEARFSNQGPIASNPMGSYIWGGILWKLRTRLGASAADWLLFNAWFEFRGRKALQALVPSNPKFPMLPDGSLHASDISYPQRFLRTVLDMNSVNGGLHDKEIKEVFAAGGITL